MVVSLANFSLCTERCMKGTFPLFCLFKPEPMTEAKPSLRPKPKPETYPEPKPKRGLRQSLSEN